jgi:DNA-binding NarL/FixJ family response regulator
MSITPIRTFIVDDHPAMRAGVAAVLDPEEDIVVVGAATGGRQMWRTLDTADPDVVLMDFDLDGEDGVILCHRLKRRPDAPGVVLYSAFADRRLISPAMLAHADALLSKRADASVVCDAVRDAARPSTPPVLPADERERLGTLLDDQERADQRAEHAGAELCGQGGPERLADQRPGHQCDALQRDRAARHRCGLRLRGLRGLSAHRGARRVSRRRRVVAAGGPDSPPRAARSGDSARTGAGSPPVASPSRAELFDPVRVRRPWRTTSFDRIASPYALCDRRDRHWSDDFAAPAAQVRNP